MSRLKEALLVVGLAFLSGILLFIPTLKQLGGENDSMLGQLNEAFFHTSDPEVLLGDGVDPVGSIWIVGFVQEVVFEGRPTIVKELYAPFGLDLGVHEGFAWLDTLFAMPLRAWIGSPGFYHLHVLLTLVYSFLACYLVFKQSSKSVLLSLFCAHLMVVNEFVYQEISYGRPTQVNWLFGALFVYCCLRLMEKKKKPRWAFFGGLCFGGYCLTYWFGAAGLGFMMALWLIGSHLKDVGLGRTICNALVVLLGIVLVILPICWRAILPILQGKGSKAYSPFLQDPVDFFALGFVELPIYSTESIMNWNDALVFVEGRHFPLWLLCAFPLVCFAYLRRGKLAYLLLLCLCIMLPVGSSLTIQESIFPTSYAVLEWIFPPLVRCNFPDRLMLAPLMLVPLLGLLSYKNYFTALLQARSRLFFLAMIGILLGNLARVWTSHTPAVQSFSINRSLVQLAKVAPGGLIEFPFDRGNSTYVQSEFHRQPILTGPGMMMVQPPESKRYRQKNKVLQDVMAINARGFTPADKPTNLDLLELYKDGFRHFVFYTEEIQQPVQVFERYLRTKGVAYPEHNIHVIPIPVEL